MCWNMVSTLTTLIDISPCSRHPSSLQLCLCQWTRLSILVTKYNKHVSHGDFLSMSSYKHQMFQAKDNLSGGHKLYLCEAWGCASVIETLRRLRQKDCESHARQGYVVKPCLKRKNLYSSPHKYRQGTLSLCCPSFLRCHSELTDDASLTLQIQHIQFLNLQN